MDPETGWRPSRREKPEAQAGRRESQVRSRQVLGGPLWGDRLGQELVWLLTSGFERTALEVAQRPCVWVTRGWTVSLRVLAWPPPPPPGDR